jgi:hypothetical protein
LRAYTHKRRYAEHDGGNFRDLKLVSQIGGGFVGDGKAVNPVLKNSSFTGQAD